MGDIAITLVLVTIITTLWLYKYMKECYDFWKHRGVPYLKPNLLFGNFANITLRRVSMPIGFLNLYKDFSPHPFAGIYAMLKPVLLIRDPELIKRIMTKDFHCFHDREMHFNHEVEPLTRHLFGTNGQEWRNLRVKLTGAFSGGKMRLMFPLMEECALELLAMLNNYQRKRNESTTIEIKDTLARYTTDVIGSCVFGLDMGSIKNPDSEFRKMGEEMMRLRFRVSLRDVFTSLPRKVIKLFKMQIVQEDVSEYFISLVRQTVEYREMNKVNRNDFLDLLINLRNDEKPKKPVEPCSEMKTNQSDAKQNVDASTMDMTIELMAAQCLIFFLAGFETTANVMTYFFVEVAKHSEIQDKMKEEIDRVLDESNGKLSYEALKKMKYIDMVINESMRMYPPAAMISRKCTKNYKIQNTDVIVPKGTKVLIFPIGLHNDEQYYTSPEKFNPDNFSDEAKLKRHPYAFLPFGEGPRGCIAKRFAKMQMKTAFVHLIRNYKFSLSEKTKLPLEFKHFILLTPKSGIWLRYHKRE